MSNVFDEIENEDSGNVFDEIIALDRNVFDELEEEEKKPGFFEKTVDIAKEIPAGVADIAKSVEAGHRERSRKADDVGFGLDLRTYNKEEKAKLKALSDKLKKEGLSWKERRPQIKELQKEIQVGMIRESAKTGMESAQKVQEVMPKPQHAEGAGFFERSGRGIIRSLPAMGATAVAAPAGAVALFHHLRGGKLNELEQIKENELRGIKDSWHIKEIEDKYNDQAR